jgi:glycosyltransferase involved in cell wall biosynthesis
MYSLVIPVYRNEGSISDLLEALTQLQAGLERPLEVVFVVDGSPDRSFALLREGLPRMSFRSRLLLLSRNFGSFAAIRCGLEAANGRYFAVMAADLQEPPELAAEFFRLLDTDTVDIVIGTRETREDPLGPRLGSGMFWWLYRKLINAEIPPGGVDVFGCNRRFRDHLLKLDEHHSSLIGLLFWLGFRRRTVSYTRRARKHGTSAWTLRRKVKYMLDSVFAFSDLPIRVLLLVGIGGISVSLLFGALVLVGKLSGQLAVPGYAATIITILFFGGLNALGLGIIGAYVWRAFANTQRRPLSVVMEADEFAGRTDINTEPTR